MRITYIILAFLVILRLNEKPNSNQYNSSSKCRFWFELCRAEIPSEYKYLLISKSEIYLQKLKSKLRSLILKNEDRDLRGIFTVLYLAEWEIIRMIIKYINRSITFPSYFF